MDVFKLQTFELWKGNCKRFVMKLNGDFKFVRNTEI